MPESQYLRDLKQNRQNKHSVVDKSVAGGFKASLYILTEKILFLFLFYLTLRLSELLEIFRILTFS